MPTGETIWRTPHGLTRALVRLQHQAQLGQVDETGRYNAER